MNADGINTLEQAVKVIKAKNITIEALQREVFELDKEIAEMRGELEQ